MSENYTNPIQPVGALGNDNDDALSPDSVQGGAQNPSADKKVKLRVGGKWCGLLGCLFTLLAWGSLVFLSQLSIACGILGLLLSCFGIKGMTRGWRDLATTSIIASSVLLLVFAIFFFGIRVAVNSL